MSNPDPATRKFESEVESGAFADLDAEANKLTRDEEVQAVIDEMGMTRSDAAAWVDQRRAAR